MGRKPAIVLFDQDLRLRDHPALYKAAKTKKPLILAYVLPIESRRLGKNQRWWLHHSLKALQASCKQRGHSLVLRRGSLETEVAQLICESKADALFWNHSPLPPMEAAYAKLKKLGVELACCQGNFLLAPEDLRFYKVFTPFWRAALTRMEVPKPLPIPNWESGPRVRSDALTAWKLLDCSYASTLAKTWKPGEEEGRKQLKRFTKQGLPCYDSLRDRVDLDQTSRLSPYLHFGELSIREVWHQTKGDQTFQKELGFREFSYHLLHHFPKLPTQNFQSRFNRFSWKKDSSALKRWKEGKTGYPIVDAAMRQLTEKGWMHNRARMITASFLIKDLLIDWREGEKWFWEHLVDADVALNSFNWQWVAGCGADAAPYFRIFNPVTQGKKFDPDGRYIRQYLPKLKKINTEEIHTPWEYGIDYPDPIVDHAVARERALKLEGVVKS